MKKIFITGANGFIGKNLYEQLKDKYHFLIPPRKELDLLNGQQVDKYFKNNNIDVVIHAAIVGGSIKEQEAPSALSDNLKIFLNIIKNKDKFQKMIQLGTGAEYDKSKSLIKVKEIDFGKSIPQDDYSLYKYIASKIIDNMNNVVSLRIFGLFGKYDDYRLRFISNSICKNLLRLSITINQNRYFDYMFIDDFVKIVNHFISHKARYKFYNIGTGSKIDLITILNIINSIGDKKSEITIKKPGLGNEYTCDNQRLIKEIKNIRFADINKSIKNLYQWYKNHGLCP